MAGLVPANPVFGYFRKDGMPATSGAKTRFALCAGMTVGRGINLVIASQWVRVKRGPMTGSAKQSRQWEKNWVASSLCSSQRRISQLTPARRNAAVDRKNHAGGVG